MARLTLGQKAERITRFNLALRNPAICEALKQHGFTRDDLREGHELLSRVAESRLALPSAPQPADPALVTAIDGWENKWYPIIDAALSRHFPAIREAVFLNLAQTSGPEVIHTVAALVDRVEKLSRPKSEGGFGREGKEARDLLTKRGLTAQVIRGVKGSLELVGEPSTRDEAVAVPADEETESEREMWAWYLEWSTIARAAIKDRRLLRTLGFLQTDRSKEAEPKVEKPAEDPPSPSEPTSDQ